MATLRRCIVQAHDEHHDKLAEFSVPIISSWCKRNMWNHIVHRVSSDQEAWDHNYRKYPLVRSLLTSYDIVVWMDLDVIPVSEEDLILTYDNVQISSDRHGLCAGVVAYRSCAWTVSFVEGLTAIIPKWGLHRTHEQDTLKALSILGDASNHVRTIPETVVANPGSPRTGKPPAFYHAWSNAGIDGAIERMRAACNYTQIS